MRIIIVICLFFITDMESHAVSCDCTSYPFEPDPPCYDICAAQYLEVATFSELQEILGIDPETAKQIVSMKGGENPQSLSGYQEFLSQEQFNKLKGSLKLLDSSAYQQLRALAGERGQAFEDSHFIQSE